jgi:hypothetical protein
MNQQERQIKQNPFSQQREVQGQLIFDQQGQSIGVAISDGSFDYASPDEKARTVLIIEKSEKEQHE